MIEPVQILDDSVLHPTRQVPSLVEASARTAGKRVREKSFCRQIRPLPIAAADVQTTDVKFPWDTNGDRPQVAIEQMDFRVCYGPADRDGIAREFSVTLPRCNIDRCLSGSIEIVQLCVEALKKLRLEIAGQRFTAADYQAQRRTAPPPARFQKYSQH